MISEFVLMYGTILACCIGATLVVCLIFTPVVVFSGMSDELGSMWGTLLGSALLVGLLWPLTPFVILAALVVAAKDTNARRAARRGLHTFLRDAQS